MGIPVYFKKIIQEHANIMQPVNAASLPDNFYLDANSIIYDAARDCQNKIGIVTDTLVIDATIHKIRSLIKIVKPLKCTFVAFDGIAPMGKMIQQRERRWKSSLCKQYTDSSDLLWDTMKITPGTEFMNLLSERVEKELADCATVSGSNEAGEGEHKIFKEVRSGDKGVVAIYGLDADLIMLSLLHLRHCSAINLFRETPEYITSIDSALDPNQTYFIDINQLAVRLLSFSEAQINDVDSKISDYVFACFLLGNDFLPHFPALSLRNNGMERLMKQLFECWRDDKNLVSGARVNWFNFKKLVTSLSKDEQAEFKRHNNKRMRPHEDENAFSALPILDKRLEREIAPQLKNWETRYYKLLTKNDSSSQHVLNICRLYCAQLEWCLRYYIGEKVDWQSAYELSYPPLLCDLSLYMEQPCTAYCTSNMHAELAQLLFVLPPSGHYLLPSDISEKLEQRHRAKLVRVVWAYCRYFWESHLEFQDQSFTDCSELVNKYDRSKT